MRNSAPHLTDDPAALVRKLERIVRESGLSETRFCEWVLGVQGQAITRWRRSGVIPLFRRSWINRLDSVHVHGDELVIRIRPGASIRHTYRRNAEG